MPADLYLTFKILFFLKKSLLINGHLRKDSSSNEIDGVAALLFRLQCVHEFEIARKLFFYFMNAWKAV